MSFKVKKLIVGRGKTTTNEKQSEWIKEYYELEVDIPDEHELSIAKENAEGLLNEWLGITQPVGVQKKQEKTGNPDKIKWILAEGASGPYERSEDVNSLDFKALLKDLEQHDGKLSHDGFFYWKFEKSAVIGRKLRQKAK